MGNYNLKDRYGRVSMNSNQTVEMIGVMGSWVGGSWEWNFHWRSDMNLHVLIKEAMVPIGITHVH